MEGFTYFQWLHELRRIHAHRYQWDRQRTASVLAGTSREPHEQQVGTLQVAIADFANQVEKLHPEFRVAYLARLEKEGLLPYLEYVQGL